jgi:hypothetical protein
MAEGWLTGWKEIAAYIGLSVRTCKRYKKKYSLPIRSLPGGKPAALPMELDDRLITFNDLKDQDTAAG